jgi:hypothetical protein
MKTLGKLNILSEKVMKNEELMTLRGGYNEEDPTGVSCFLDGTVLGCVEIIQCGNDALSACSTYYPEATGASYSCHTRC